MYPETTTILPAQDIPTIPASPSGIHPDASIADLNAIKTAWTQQAHEAGHPEIIYHVVSRLGREVIARPRGHVNRLWSSGRIYAFIREYEERYTLADGTHQMTYYLSVYLGEPDLGRENPIDQIIFSSKMVRVAYWRWKVLGEQVTEPQDNFLFPGKWLDVILAAETSADRAASETASEKDEEERQRLLAELLAGQDI